MRRIAYCEFCDDICINGDTGAVCGTCHDNRIRKRRRETEAVEAERDALLAEVSRLREALRTVAERQREACAKATEETWPENPVRAARIRATPLVTGRQP